MKGLDVACGMLSLLLAAALVFMIVTYVGFDGFSFDALTTSAQPASQPASTTPAVTPSTPAQTPASSAATIVPKGVALYMLSPEYLGAGWTVYNEEKAANGYYKRDMTKATAQVILSCQAKIFSSVEETNEEYGGYLAFVADSYSYEEVNIGDQGIVYAQGNSGFRCIITSGTVVVMIDMATPQYGGSLVNVKRYAGVLALKLS